MFKIISNCRSCNSKNLKKILNLGIQPLANNLLKKKKTIEAKFPLVLLYCKSCFLVQISHDIKKEKLFTNYFWITSTSSAARKFSKKFYIISKKFFNKKKTFIVEIASNDGLFLKEFRKHKILGVEPANNLSVEANAKGIPTLNKFFNLKTSKYIKKKYGPSNYIFARNVIAHVSEIHSIVEGIAHLLDDDGVVAIEFHYTYNILKDLQFDSIYHEHIFYYSLNTISSLFEMHNLYAFDISFSPISGGAMIVFFSKRKRKPSNKIINQLNFEKKNKINSLESWINFSKRVKEFKKQFKHILQIKFKKKIISAYGASARSSTLLNYCGINNYHINYIYDKNPKKHLLFTPGSKIQILPVTKINKEKPIIILSWNFYNEVSNFLRKIKFTGSVIKPLPKKPVVIKKL